MRARGLAAAAWVCFGVQLGTLSFLRRPLGMYLSPIIFFLASLLLTVLLLRLAKQKSNTASLAKKQDRRSWWTILFLFASMAFAGWILLRSYFSQYPVDPAGSDIIPLIKVLTGRFVSGQKVYSEINEFGYRMYPNYLPLMWGPFVMADWLQLDYRTMAYLIFCLCALVPAFVLTEPLSKKTITVVFPFFIFVLFLLSQPAAFGWTVETMISGFYLLLVYGLYKRKALLIAFALVCCLLSRYAVVLVLPFLACIFFYWVSKKSTFLVIALTAAGISTLFVFPFLIQQPEILSKGFAYYTQGALAEWRGQSWQPPDALPFQLSQGYGFAIFFYRKENIAQSLGFLQKVHLACCFLGPLLFTVWYFRKGKNWLSPAVFMMLLLQLYLAIFFAFIQVPYAYLFFTPLLISGVTTLLISLLPSKTG